MNKKISVTTLVLTVLLSMLAVFMLTYALMTEHYRAKLAEAYGEDSTIQSDGDSSEDGLPENFIEKLKALDTIFRDSSYFDLDYDAILDDVLKGYADGTGDKYAEYYTAEEFAVFMEDSEGEMQGIGINIIYNTEYGVIEVINVMPDSPALKAGVEPGDLILTVGIGDDAQSVEELGYYPAVALLQGKAGTLCEFIAARGKNYSERVEFSIERGYVTEQTVMYHQYEKNPEIGIVKLLEFDGKTPDQFFEALDALSAAGATKFIFDVRYNPGGDLQAICEILDFLLPEGPIIRMRDKDGIETSISSEASEFSAPIAVLCNRSTASAAELFTSALMDYGKAVSIGNLTYGKGSMQTIRQLGDGSGVKLTTKMYFPPFSEGYDGIGITPDIEIDMDEAVAEKNIYKITDEEDTQLQRAVAYLEENQ